MHTQPVERSRGWPQKKPMSTTIKVTQLTAPDGTMLTVVQTSRFNALATVQLPDGTSKQASIPILAAQAMFAELRQDGWK
jgi:hypothetical protein